MIDDDSFHFIAQKDRIIKVIHDKIHICLVFSEVQLICRMKNFHHYANQNFSNMFISIWNNNSIKGECRNLSVNSLFSPPPPHSPLRTNSQFQFIFHTKYAKIKLKCLSSNHKFNYDHPPLIPPIFNIPRCYSIEMEFRSKILFANAIWPKNRIFLYK